MEVYNEGFEDWTALQQQEEVSQHEVLLGARFFSIHQRAGEASSWPQTSVGDVKAGEGRTTTRTG